MGRGDQRDPLGELASGDRLATAGDAVSEPRTDATALLETRGVWKWLGAGRSRPPALRDVSLSVPRGTWTVITGPSGSGKTTLLSLLGALDHPSEGQVLFEGRDLAGFSDMGLARVRR